MNKLIALALLVVACNTRTTADVQKEYDSVLKEQRKVKELLQVGNRIESEGRNMDEYLKNDTTELRFQKFMDSLHQRAQALEKRRGDLARRLYK